MHSRSFLSHPLSRNKCNQCKSQLWNICVVYKFNCSLCMLFVFGLLVLYIRDNCWNISIHIPNQTLSENTTSSKSYLNKLTSHTMSSSSCPYTNPTYPSIGADMSYICPLNKPYRIGTSWYLFKHVQPILTGNDLVYFNNFIDQIDVLRSFVMNITHSNKDLQVSFKPNNDLHMAYQYISCQSGTEINRIKSEWDKILNVNKYENIFQKYGFSSWNDLKICFDEILCMNDDYRGAVTYNLYLNEQSQNLMKELVEITEQIEQNTLDINLSFKRNIDQQSFHITLFTIVNPNDFNSFDAKLLMDMINNEIKNNIGCIMLGVQPFMRDKWCYNTRKLNDKTKFKWNCELISDV
eukprot:188751_1